MFDRIEFYRYVWQEYATLGSDGEFCSPSFPNPKLKLETYVLIKETKKGYWIGIENFLHYKKWIPKVSKRRYAYPTKEEAITNFIARTKRRIHILKWQLACCEIAMDLAKNTKF